MDTREIAWKNRQLLAPLSPTGWVDPIKPVESTWNGRPMLASTSNGVKKRGKAF
jgi:hypothetical protein